MINNRSSSIFFFQAEDGIRDGHVTGVQTCALPISQSIHVTCTTAGIPLRLLYGGRSYTVTAEPQRWYVRRRWWAEEHRAERSEERRVGKECRCMLRMKYLKKK